MFLLISWMLSSSDRLIFLLSLITPFLTIGFLFAFNVALIFSTTGLSSYLGCRADWYCVLLLFLAGIPLFKIPFSEVDPVRILYLPVDDFLSFWLLASVPRSSRSLLRVWFVNGLLIYLDKYWSNVLWLRFNIYATQKRFVGNQIII